MITYVHSGLIAGFMLGIVLSIYVLVRRAKLVASFKDQDKSIARLSDRELFLIVFGCSIAVAILFGTVAGILYG